jgi:hypothetical protein
MPLLFCITCIDTKRKFCLCTVNLFSNKVSRYPTMDVAALFSVLWLLEMDIKAILGIYRVCISTLRV